ncbi:PID-CTERM protein-sorting domain-containing protein [Winogradskyella sp. A2]|uniref:PID-CTERM protein-sorting domain-containing protein n=1 Tax=Winogradskyella sp. A2 TaxID=3366944 RepID=UPI00398C5A24
MKNSRIKLSKFIGTLAIVLALVATTNLNAQGPPGGETDTQDVPLDGGLIALVIGAAAYGVKKLRDKRQ